MNNHDALQAGKQHDVKLQTCIARQLTCVGIAGIILKILEANLPCLGVCINFVQFVVRIAPNIDSVFIITIFNEPCAHNIDYSLLNVLRCNSMRVNDDATYLGSRKCQPWYSETSPSSLDDTGRSDRRPIDKKRGDGLQELQVDVLRLRCVYFFTHDKKHSSVLFIF